MKNNIIVFILMIIESAHGTVDCFIPPSAYDATRSFPYLAKTVLMGKVINYDKRTDAEASLPKKFGAMFISGPPFPLIKIPITTGGCEFGMDKSERKVVFISTREFSSSTSEKESITIGGGTFVAIEELTGRVLRNPYAQSPPDKGDILDRKELPEGHPNIFWGYCEKFDKCTKVKDSCGNMHGVNERHKAKLEKYFHKKKNDKCETPVKLEKISKCVEYFCS